VRGELLTELPHDLYDPRMHLEIFLRCMLKAPLDLYADYLIRRQNLDVLDIPMAR